MPSFLILANCAEYRLFHRLCIYQDRATEHLRPNRKKKKCSILDSFLPCHHCREDHTDKGKLRVFFLDGAICLSAGHQT